MSATVHIGDALTVLRSMPPESVGGRMRRCVDCGADISQRHWNAYLCAECSRRRHNRWGNDLVKAIRRAGGEVAARLRAYQAERQRARYRRTYVPRVNRRSCLVCGEAVRARGGRLYCETDARLQRSYQQQLARTARRKALARAI